MLAPFKLESDRDKGVGNAPRSYILENRTSWLFYHRDKMDGILCRSVELFAALTLFSEPTIFCTQLPSSVSNNIVIEVLSCIFNGDHDGVNCRCKRER